MQKASGVTLIELMIVLLIVALLASLAYPSYADYLTRARRMEGQVALFEALQLQEQYHALHHSYAAFSADLPLAGMRWWSAAQAASSAYELDAEACPDSSLRDCVRVRARPGTARVDSRYHDPGCGALSLDSRGEQGASGAAPRCWR